MDAPALLTGATGYIGGWRVRLVPLTLFAHHIRRCGVPYLPTRSICSRIRSS
jgi:hypothetical protein